MRVPRPGHDLQAPGKDKDFIFSEQMNICADAHAKSLLSLDTRSRTHVVRLNTNHILTCNCKQNNVVSPAAPGGAGTGATTALYAALSGRRAPLRSATKNV